MIRTFADRQTEKLFREGKHKRLSANLLRPALRKLALIHDAPDLATLARVPGNRLEKLRGSRREQNSLRINQQWRICFRWQRGDAYDVEVVDYHP